MLNTNYKVNTLKTGIRTMIIDGRVEVFTKDEVLPSVSSLQKLAHKITKWFKL